MIGAPPVRCRSAGAPSGGRSRALFCGAFSGLFLVLALPFLLTPTPALLDYPNHLARVFILNHWASDAALRLYYQPHWAVLPNLAFDVLGVALNRVLPIYLAGQVTLVLALLLMASGLAVLGVTLHRRAEPFCLVGFLLIVSNPFTYGFINLVLGFGLVLWGLAAWLRLRSRPAPLVLAWAVPFALLLFFAHLFAFAVYGITLACIELTFLRDAPHPARALRRVVLLGAAQAAIPAALFLFASPTPLDASSSAFTGSLFRRLVAIALAPVRSYDDAVDLITLGAVAAVFLVGLGTRRLLVAREMRLALVVLALLCPCIPNVLATSANAEIRLPVIVCLLLAASVSWRAPRRGLAVAAGLLLFALLVMRTDVTMAAFAQSDRFAAEMKAALAAVPTGARIGSVTLTTPAEHRMRPEWQHSICYEVIERSALVPTIFAFPTQQPLQLTASVQATRFPPDHLVSVPGHPFPAELFAGLDYFVLVNPAALQTELPENLRLVSQYSQFRVYRVVRDGGY